MSFWITKFESQLGYIILTIPMCMHNVSGAERNQYQSRTSHLEDIKNFNSFFNCIQYDVFAFSKSKVYFLIPNKLIPWAEERFEGNLSRTQLVIMPNWINQPNPWSNISQILEHREFFDGSDEFIKWFEFSCSYSETSKLNYFNTKFKFVSVTDNFILSIENDKIDHSLSLLPEFMVIFPHICIVSGLRYSLNISSNLWA